MADIFQVFDGTAGDVNNVYNINLAVTPQVLSLDQQPSDNIAFLAITNTAIPVVTTIISGGVGGESKRGTWR